MAKIKLTDITIDPAVGIREGTDEDTIARYMDTFDELPPLIVYQTDHKYLLADGFHRWAAATRLGKEDIEADIVVGTPQEASEAAIYANLKHGKPLSREEYKNAVRRLQLLHPNWGIEKLRKAVGRSEHFIQTIRKSDELRRVTTVTLNDRIAETIYSTPKEQWHDIAEVAAEQDWTLEKTTEKVREIKSSPERIDEILAIEPPETQESETSPQPFELLDIVHEMNDFFADIAEMRVQHKLNKEILSKFAPDVYTWRDAVNELIKILES